MADSKMEKIKQLLVRYIRDNQLKKGDKLPGQAFFRKAFDCGSITVLSAIHALKADGVLEVRDKVGVYVIDPNTDGHAGRVVGITARHVEGSPYYSTLLGALQMKLVREGCRVNIFGYSEEHRNETNPFDFSLNDFPGLRRSIEDGEIHGLIHLDDLKKSALDVLRKRRIPTLFCGSTGISPDGVFLDQENALKQMYAHAVSAGCRRIALQVPGSIQRYLEPLFLALGGVAERVYPAYTIENGIAIAERLASLPEKARPDAFLCFDDIIGQWIFGTLVLKVPPETLPRAYIVRNRQLMMCFPVPHAVYFNIDLLEFSDLIVSKILDAMKTNSTEIGRIQYNIKEGE